MVAMRLKSLLLFVAVLESTTCLHVPGQANNVAVVLVHAGGETRACAGFPVANQWVISSANCFTDRWRGHIKILAGTRELSKDVFHDADTRNVSGIFQHPSSRTPGSNYTLKLFHFTPGYNQSNDVQISNATSWDEVGNGNCSVSGFGRDGSMVTAVLSAKNASLCWKDSAVCFEETSGAVVECGGSAVAIAVPEGGGPKRNLQFLGRYKKWMDDLNVKQLGVREASDDSDYDCNVPFWIQSEERCASSCSLSSVMFVLGACLFASM